MRFIDNLRFKTGYSHIDRVLRKAKICIVLVTVITVVTIALVLASIVLSDIRLFIGAFVLGIIGIIISSVGVQAMHEAESLTMDMRKIT